MNQFNKFFFETMEKLLENDGAGVGAMTDASVFNVPDVSNTANMLGQGNYAPNDNRNPFNRKKKRKIKKRL
jgi:hypothetical protein